MSILKQNFQVMAAFMIIVTGVSNEDFFYNAYTHPLDLCVYMIFPPMNIKASLWPLDRLD